MEEFNCSIFISISSQQIATMAKKTVFVTGGGGYVASHCIVELLKCDFDVVAVDNFVNSIRGKND